MYDVCKELRVEARRHNRLNRIATEERKEWLMETLEEHRVRGRDKERAKHKKLIQTIQYTLYKSIRTDRSTERYFNAHK